MHMFFLRGLRCNEYKPSGMFEDAIDLTEYGEKCADILRRMEDKLEESEIKYILFLHFFHEDLFIDVSKTKLDSLIHILDNEIISNRITYPYINEKILYDRYHSMFGDKRGPLLFEESIKLLEDTPKGVYQLGEYLIGPFGLLRSSFERYLPPTLKAPLWRCTDLSCESVHPVQFLQKNDKVQKLYGILSSEKRLLNDVPSRWDEYYKYLLDEKYVFFDDMALRYFPQFLANSFSLSETRLILDGLIESYSKEIRQLFPNRAEIKGKFDKNPKYITDSLNKAECLQLILLLSDDKIIEILESLIEKSIIEIPATEIRSTLIKGPYHGGWVTTNIECSKNGVRTTANGLGLARLEKMIKTIYITSSDLELLDWKLRHVDGQSRFEKLDKYIFSKEPHQILSDLILNSPAQLKKAIELLRYGKFIIPENIEEENKIIQKLLWKIGFDVNLYPEYINLFWSRYEKFISASIAYKEYDEESQELIRSSGVNFFVSLEQILGYSLSFITWALLSDHYRDTKFILNLSDAQAFMASKLSGITIGDEKLEFDPSGKNTLFPLISGFNALADKCLDLISNEEKHRRSNSEIPDNFKESSLEILPFMHDALILDIRENDKERILGLLREITRSLTKAQVCNIRNRIDHSRSLNEFPKFEEMKRMCAIVKEIVNDMISIGICPSVSYRTKTDGDEYGRYITKFRNCYGNEIPQIISPKFFSCKLPDSRNPNVIVPGIHIGDSGVLIRFIFEETSEFTNMWRGYSRRDADLGRI